MASIDSLKNNLNKRPTLADRLEIMQEVKPEVISNVKPEVISNVKPEVIGEVIGEVKHDVIGEVIATQGRKGCKKPLISLRINTPELLQQIKKQAKKEGKGQTQFINDAIIVYLRGSK